MRNFAALIVVVGGAALVMFGHWDQTVGMNDLLFTALCAGATGAIASLVGRVNGTVWYAIWLLGIAVFDEINNNPKGDPEFVFGVCAMGCLPFR